MRRVWREHRATIFHWAMEVVVVVIGVLLALSVQQWAEDRGSRQRAKDAEARIRQELLSGSFDIVERIAVHGCLRQRLIELGDGVTKGGPDWRPSLKPELITGRLAFQRVYRVPSRNFSSETFRGAVSGGDIAGLGAERIASIAGIYSIIASIGSQNDEEVQLAAGLGSLQFGGASAKTDRGQTLSALTRLDQINSSLRLLAEQHLAALHRIGLAPTGYEMEQVRRGGFFAKWAVEGRAKYGKCFDAGAMAALGPASRKVAAR